ncbi:DUF4388 domain-containing protein [Myxococcota bacterium]|nr:DUF4388 domain-containing protein [Myxococcota bacterium]
MATQPPPKGPAPRIPSAQTGSGRVPVMTPTSVDAVPRTEDVLRGELDALAAAFEDEEPTLPAQSSLRPRDGSGDLGPPPTSTQPLPSLDVEVVLPDDDARLTLELLPDGRLRAPAPDTRELLRHRLRKAEVLRTGPRWAVLRTLDVPESVDDSVGFEREVIAAGTLGERGISLIDFIGFIANGQLTGVLSAASGDVTRSVFFFRGDVVWASSTGTQDRFGEFLLSRGKVTREQLAAAVRDGEKRIGRACVERGFLSAHELYGLVQAQLTEIFDRLLAMDVGMWFFTRVSQETLAASQIHLSTQGLLVDALRRLDEMQIYRQRVRTPNVVVQRVKGQKPGASGGASEAPTDDLVAQLDESVRANAGQLLRHLPGSATILELMRICGRGEFEVTRTVYHLLRRGIVEIVPQQETGPIPRRLTAISKTEAHEVISIYSMAFREMFEEVARMGRAAELQMAANAFLRDESTAYAHLLRAASLAPDGTIDESAMLGALAELAISSQELSDALSELLFFVLFQATEFLGRRRGDDLARRVKLILGMLAHAGAAGGERLG